jgi:hypothetical protein
LILVVSVRGGGDDGVIGNDEPFAELTAEWALWGKGAENAEYGVLECSAGTLKAGDFLQIIRRYALGTPDRLPQYTVAWIPAEADGVTAFIGLAIHEHAPYGLAGRNGRNRYDALGREIVFIRLFCVPYESLARNEVSYTELLEAIQDQELPPRTVRASRPVTICIPPRKSLRTSADPAKELAEMVAVLLLTDVKVCVVTADTIPAAERLAFIDSILSLLPYGMRATLSASTWASSTALDLKLRLYFAEAPSEDGGRIRHVWWELPDAADIPEPDDVAARLYLDWLRHVGSRAPSLLTGRTAPLRFTDEHIRRMVAALPRDLTVADAIEDAAASLSDRGLPAIQVEVKRLRRYLADALDPAEREECRRRVIQLNLLKDHPDIPASTCASLYRTLLELAFESPLTYVGFCEIEDAVSGPPGAILRSVLLEGKFATFVPWLLTAKTEPGFSDEDIMKSLAKRGTEPTALLTGLERNIGTMRSEHRATAFDFMVLYVRTCAEDPRAELVRRGYFMEMLEEVFPGSQHAQRIRLESMLQFIYGDPISRSRIRELFADEGLYPTPAFEAAVKHLAPWTEPFIDKHAAYTPLGYQRDSDGSYPAHPRPRLLQFIYRLLNGYDRHAETSKPE